jgi:hypothetical protein
MTAIAMSSHVGADGPARVRDLLSGPARPAEVLGRFATAVYMRVRGGDVIALLSSDAVRLPIGLILPMSSRELPLARLTGQVVVGSGAVRIGRWSCRVSRLISPTAPSGLTPDSQAYEHLRLRLEGRPGVNRDPRQAEPLAHGVHYPRPSPDLVRRLVGVGPGLTPAGDDLLAGILIGLWGFDMTAEPFRSAVLAAAPTGTTALSAELLRCAARGESIPQMNQLLRAMSASTWQERLDDALDDLIRVGHTSGLALATGVLTAAAEAIADRREA